MLRYVSCLLSIFFPHMHNWIFHFICWSYSSHILFRSVADASEKDVATLGFQVSRGWLPVDSLKLAVVYGLGLSPSLSYALSLIPCLFVPESPGYYEWWTSYSSRRLSSCVCSYLILNYYVFLFYLLILSCQRCQHISLSLGNGS